MNEEGVMSRERRNRKVPDIDVLARHYLGRGLSHHPDIAKHVERVEEVEKMGMWSLLTLAKKMGVDSDEMIRRTEQEEQALHDYSFNYPGFKGELHFDLTFTFLGKSVTRKAKVVYEHTPEWPYYDLRKQAEFTGWDSYHYHIELQAVPEEHHDDRTITFGTPRWVEMTDLVSDDVLPHEAWDVVLDAVDEKCKAEDAERRRVAAAAKRAALSPKSKRQH
jgi:hypothetical protein